MGGMMGEALGIHGPSSVPSVGSHGSVLLQSLVGPAPVALLGDAAAQQAHQHHQSLPSRKRKLTPAEKQQQNRDRNREHARNTRLRKKAYVDKLKVQLYSLARGGGVACHGRTD